jgi:C1A family cysteine protease
MSQDDLMDLQRAIRDQGHTWEAGPTPLSALPPEQQARRLGLRLIPEEMDRIKATLAETVPKAVEFPSGWDWRNVEGADWTTAIRDQGACGSCVAFGTVATLEAMLKLHYDDASQQPDLSEAHRFFCGCGNCCDQGWWPTYALDYAKSSGVPDEACFPYQDHDMACSNSCTDWQSRAVKVVSWSEVLDVGQRKEWLATKGPMVGCMAVYQDFFSYTGGVYRHTSGNLAGYHAISVVGYSEAEQCWICKNSWDTGWGESGWFKIGYGECKIDTEFAMYGVEAVTPPSPEPPPPPPPPPPPKPGCNVPARVAHAIRALWEGPEL